MRRTGRVALDSCLPDSHLRSPRQLLGHAPNLRGESPELAGEEKVEHPNGGQLGDHPRARGIVEGACQLLVATLQEAEDIQVALVVTARMVLSDSAHLVQDTLAESPQRQLAKLTEDLPVRFRHSVDHDILAV